MVFHVSDNFYFENIEKKLRDRYCNVYILYVNVCK